MLTSTPANRSAARLALLVAQFHVETAERYRKRDVTGDGVDETWCNKLAEDVSAAMGAPIPLGLRANEQHEYLLHNADTLWESVDAHTAQTMADEGQLAVASWFNPMRREDGTFKSGHIAIVMPSLGEPGVWTAQAGAVNFTRELLQRGFGAIAPDYFVHP